MGPAPAHRLILTSTEFLQPGMFVAALDRAWAYSPFPGPLLITGDRQIHQLRQSCRYVYVDAERSAAHAGGRPALAGEIEQANPAAEPNPLGASRRAIDVALHTMTELVQRARREHVVDLEPVTRCAADIAARLLEDVDALHWALRTEDHASYLMRRAVGTAVVAATLGRHLGFERPVLESLALGGMLLDLGKIAVPVPILAKPQALSGTEQTYVRRHVERGLELLAGCDLDPRAREMLAGHHERLDGSGYPRQLHGTSIPLFARIAAIADACDAMTLDRRYAAALSPQAAVYQLQAQQGEKFDAALVDELVHALGTYPVGTLVELVDGSLGMVCAQRAGHPHQPHVVVTHDTARRALAAARVSAATGPTDIVRSLAPNVAPVDISRLEPALHDFYPSPHSG